MSITSVFVNGGSQAVRIPKKYRFSTDRVTVQPMKGGILILPMAHHLESLIEGGCMKPMVEF